MKIEKDIRIQDLEKLWAEEKYLVLSKSQNLYKEIREELKNKENPNGENILNLLQKARDLPPSTSDFINASQHIWGYFKNETTKKEKEEFLTLLEKYRQSIIDQRTIKVYLKDYL
ncbi:MAG: YbgA family protein, partial [Tissierellia bacterium]|nr:YbgA family protein [Tissierellia bacterium]